MEPKIYHLRDREVHQFGFYVSVVWRVKEQTEEQEGNRRTITTVRDGKPYISFYWIRGEGDDIWIDDDSTVAGGLSVGQAEEVAQGLAAAIAYIRSL